MLLAISCRHKLFAVLVFFSSTLRRIDWVLVSLRVLKSAILCFLWSAVTIDVNILRQIWRRRLRVHLGSCRSLLVAPRSLGQPIAMGSSQLGLRLALALSGLRACPRLLLFLAEILGYYQLSSRLQDRLPLRSIRHHILQLPVFLRMLLQFLHLDRWLHEMDLLEHPYVLIDLLLKLILPIHVVQ